MGKVRRWSSWGAFAAAIAAAACSSQPTSDDTRGEMLSQQREVAYGQQQFLPAQQMHGGEYRLDPQLGEYVTRVGRALAQVSDRPELPWQFVVLNNSTPNSWSLPGGKIAITRSLLQSLHDESELAAVLSHEMVHAEARHSLQEMDRPLSTNMGPTAPNLFGQDLLVSGSVALGATLINTRYGPKEELLADEHGMRYMSRAGYDAAAAVALLTRAQQGDMMQAGQGDWYSGLFAGHPPSHERLQAAQKTLTTLQPGQSTGENTFTEATRKLRGDSHAYAIYDSGVAALAQQRPDEALALSQQAIGLLPDESLFRELEGRCLEVLGQYRAALAAYDKAVALDDRYYAHLLHRGLLKYAMGDKHGAWSDLEQSHALLPTQLANHYLGVLARDRGDRKAASAWFKASAEAGGTLGSQSELMMIENDVEKWLPALLGVNAEGQLEVAVGNRSRVSFRDCEVDIIRRQGEVEQRVATITVAPVPSGFYSPRTATGIGPIDQGQLSSYSARVTHTNPAE